MTFTEIVDQIADYLDLVSTPQKALIGKEVNLVYRRVRTAVQLQPSRRILGVAGPTSLGLQEVTFEGVQKVVRVYDDSSGRAREIEEKLAEEIRLINATTSDHVTKWATLRVGANSVTILCNVKFQTEFDLRADGYDTTDDLSGSQEPAFPEDFHEILIDGVLKKMLGKRGDKQGARDAGTDYERRLSDLKLWHAKTLLGKRRQGENARGPLSALFGGSGGTGGGGAVSDPGSLSFSITGLWTFLRGAGNAPFAVQAGSATVENLDADTVDGIDGDDIVTGPASATDNAIARFDGTGGKTLQNSGITIADGASGTLDGTNTGDVTLAGSPDYITIAAQVITRALINLASHVTGRLPYVNLTAATAASKLLGRQSGSAGDWQEITLGTGLSMSSTTLNASAQSKPFMVWTALGNQPPASAYATFATRNSHPVLDFDGATDEEAVFGGVLSPDYQGGGLTCETFWAFTSATSGSLRVQAGIERIDASSLDIDSDSFASFQSAGGTAPSTNGQVIKVTITFTSGAQMDSLAAGEAFRLKIRRDADGTSGTDDITTDAELLRVVLRET